MTPDAGSPTIRGLSPKVSKMVELNNGRLDELLGAKVPTTLNQIAVEMRGDISCGHHSIMAFKDIDEMVVAEPDLMGLLPETDEFDKVKFGRCAVVGNSGTLLGAKHGPAINAHDTVIRFNGAPTARFEADVGNKTTIRIQNVDNLGYHEHQDKYLIFTARTDKDLRKFGRHRKKYKNRRQFLFNPEFWCHLWDWVAHRRLKPSTGLAGVILALRRCEGPVDLYGFHHDAKTFHYFNQIDEKTQSDVHKFHPLVEEFAIYEELQAFGKVQLIGDHRSS